VGEPIPSHPEFIGDLRVLQPIARGGTAEVFEVEDRLSGERFALKLLMAEVAERATPRFHREYEALTRLNHPNIVRVYEYGLHDGHPWLTMEILQGRSLQSRVRDVGKPGEPARNAEIVRAVGYVADALQYIHERGLIHRDLKSDNVVVLPDGRVKLLDFGSARVLDALEPITRQGEFVGTFAYAAPEQLAGRPADHRADLYALGVLMYRLATGRFPFESEDPRELARMHAAAIPVPPRERVAGIPAELDALILRSLEKNPDSRPVDARAVADVLRALQGPGQVDLGPAGRLEVQSSPTGAGGREFELRSTVSLVEGLPPGSAVVVEGDEGSGRQRFVRGVGALLEERGWAVLTCTLNAADPARQLLEFLKSIATPERREVAERLLRHHLAQGFESGEQRDALRKSAGEIVVDRAARDQRPLVVVVQNVHDATALALDVVVGIRRESALAHAEVRLLASTRDAGEEPDILVRQHLPDARRVVLRPMTVRGVALTVASLLARRPPPLELARGIHQASAGQPAYVEEVVRAMVGSGELALRGMDGNRIEWTAREIGTVPLAPSARAAVDRGLRRLSAFDRRLIEAFTLTGEDATVATIARGLDLDEPEAHGAIDALVASGWLAWDREQPEEGPRITRRLRWGRPLTRPVLEAQIHPARRELLRRRLVQAMAEDRPTSGFVRLLLDSDRVPEAARVSVRVADDLLRSGEQRAAADLLDEVVRRTTGVSVAPSVLASLFLAHARTLLLVRPTDPQVAKSLARAGELTTDLPSRAVIAGQRARLQSLVGNYLDSREQLIAAADLADRARDLRLSSTICCRIGEGYFWAGRIDAAIEAYEKARQRALQSKDPTVLAYWGTHAAPYLLATGRIEQAEQVTAEAIEAFTSAGHPGGVRQAVAVWANALREQCRYSEALTRLHQVLPDTRDGDSTPQLISLLLVTARCEVDLYRLGKAQECVDELEATVRAGEHLNLRLETRLLRGRILVASGQYREAQPILDDVIQRAKAADLVAITETARALYAESCWFLGEKDKSKWMFRDVARLLTPTGDVMALAEVLTIRARVVAEEEDPMPPFTALEESLEGQPALRVEMEQALAAARYLHARGARGPANQRWRDAANLLGQIGQTVEGTERSALRVHPWARRIRAGLAT
jgi:tetratricopeptide (TPR) repeat protein/tRNA A-37 threonylcarbamoyl transferase component Bud32